MVLNENFCKRINISFYEREFMEYIANGIVGN